MPGNGKENSKSIKKKEKVILVGDSIVSGVNGKDLSTDKFTNLNKNNCNEETVTYIDNNSSVL